MRHIWVLIPVILLIAGQAFGEGLDGEGSLTGPGSGCGIPFFVLVQTMGVDEPEILDAWTTKYPFGNPEDECYTFVKDTDTLGFVVEYLHPGGQIPKQYGQCYDCGDDEGKKNCLFPWSATVPPGVYLLVNYYEVCKFNPGNFDWAAKVGAITFGYPNPAAKRPLCFEIVLPPQ